MRDPTQYNYARTSLQWIACSPLAASAGAYDQYLTERGYAVGTIEGYFGSVAHFAHWLTLQCTGIDDIDEDLIIRFLNEHLPDCQCARRCQRSRTEARAALGHLLVMLREQELCGKRVSPIPDAITAELSEFDRYLTDVRGLAVDTRSVRLRYLRDFLNEHFCRRPLQLDLLTPANIANFIMHYTAGWAPGSIKQANNSLRSYFGFRASRGDNTVALIAALPRIVEWRLAGLPQVLTTLEIDQLLSAFDQESATGKRDYAITRCLLDLGLRRTEVARLQLEDVDWRTGTLRIRSKAKRIDLLPLPGTTARAIAAYLQDGRPSTTRREVFVRHRPPIDAPVDRDLVRNAVRNAAKRCGLEQRIRGTHILRHTLAGRLVQSGVPFKEIADLLRHRSLDTTTIYAKVDLQALAHVALPWPGRQS